MSYVLSDAEKREASSWISRMIDVLIKRGISEGCDEDYTGGSYADDLRYLAKHLEIELPSGKR